MTISAQTKAPAGSAFEVYFGTQLLRKSGDAPTGNVLVDRAFENLQRVDSFVRRELGLKGWDNKDGVLKAQLKTDLGRNAFFDVPQATILLGQRNQGTVANASFGFSPTVMGHEVGHALQSLILGKNWAQSSQVTVVDESFADVIGLGADDSDWVLGDEVPGGVPEVGVDMRDLAHPPYTRFQDVPPDKAFFYSQVMSYAAVQVAATIGKTETRQLWFEAMKRMPDQVGEVAIVPFANAVQQAAVDRYGVQSPAVQAVINAYKTIGVY